MTCFATFGAGVNPIKRGQEKHIPRCKTAIWSFDTDALASYDLICAEGTFEHLPRPYLAGFGDVTQELSLAAAIFFPETLTFGDCSRNLFKDGTGHYCYLYIDPSCHPLRSHGETRPMYVTLICSRKGHFMRRRIKRMRDNVLYILREVLFTLTFLSRHTVTFLADVTSSYIHPADSRSFRTSYGSVLFIRPHRRQHVLCYCPNPSTGDHA